MTPTLADSVSGSGCGTVVPRDLCVLFPFPPLGRPDSDFELGDFFRFPVVLGVTSPLTSVAAATDVVA